MKSWMNYGTLVLMGLVWGAVFPITKIAVSTGYKPFGIMVWQMLIGVVVSAAFLLLRGKPLNLTRKNLPVYFGVAMLGTVLPNYFSYTASAELPAGVISIIIALVPLFSMPIALLMGFEKFNWLRFLGALSGAMALLLLIGPEASLPDPTKYGFVLLMAVAPLLYGIVGNFLTYMGERGLDATQTLFGATIIALIFSVPLALGLGQWINPIQPWGAPEWAIPASAVLNLIAYILYVWLIHRAGPVFSSQVAYLVTGWGVLISMVFLGETYSSWVWLAMGLMLVGVALVRPRKT
ncbi:MAG: DMT family transporter [Rhodobacteraceae bacterium]|nr:DMT family transporter [Paracoccaceae bacterium]